MATWPAGPCGPQAGTQPATWLDPLKEENAKKSIAAGGRVPWKMTHRSYCSLSSHSITVHTGVQLLILGYDCLPSVFTANIEYNIIGQDSKEFETLVPSTVMIHLMNRKILLFNRSILSWLLESHRIKMRPSMPGGLEKNYIFDMDTSSFQSSLDHWWWKNNLRHCCPHPPCCSTFHLKQNNWCSDSLS